MALQFIVKGLILFCVLQHWVDSAFKTFGLPSRPSRRHFKKTDERVYREHANIREDSVTQREKLLHGYSSRGKSQRLAELFKLENNDHENVPNSFQPLQRKHHTSSSTRKSEYSTMTAVHTSRENVNKDYVFRDIVHNDGLNTYAVAPAPKEHEGSNWYITAVSAVLVLLVVAALCVYAPCGCLWKRPRSEVDVNCPITTSEKGMCGNCYLHRNAATKTMTYEERPHHVSVTMASNVRHHRPSSGDYSSQYTWAHGTQRPGKLNQAKSKISSLFKGSHESHLYGEPVAHRYKPLRNTDKRESLHTSYEPEWTSIGAFLNKRASGTYGSTKDTEGKFVDRYGRRSRDSLDADEVVEYALKLRPRRRQVIELQEFPLGYSKSYLNIDLESDPGVVFDPYRDQLYRRKTRVSERLTFSDSDLRELSCTDKLRNYDDSEELFDVRRPRKSSLKLGISRRRKANAKIVHFFPSNFSYDAQFVQIPPKGKMAETPVGDFERRFNLSYREPRSDLKAVQTEASHESSFDPTKADSNESTRLPENTRDAFSFNSSKEHAVDGDMQSPSTEVANLVVQSRDCTSSYVNYGCRSSTEVVMSGSKEILTGSQGYHDDVDGKQKLKSLESLSSSFTDLCKSDLNYKPEPLAGLLSPIRRAAHKRVTDREGIVTSQTAGDLVCVTSHVQPLSTSKYTVPFADSIYQPQPDDTTRCKSNQSQSEFEKDVWGMDKTPCYESIQHFPEKEKKTES